jgi:hypothetical protein
VRRSLERGAARSSRPERRRTAARVAPRESRRPSPPEDGSLIGRRVGRSAERLRSVAERPEKLRRDVWVDTAQPGTSASDRKVGAGSTAQRNTSEPPAPDTAILGSPARRR